MQSHVRSHWRTAADWLPKSWTPEIINLTSLLPSPSFSTPLINQSFERAVDHFAIQLDSLQLYILWVLRCRVHSSVKPAGGSVPLGGPEGGEQRLPGEVPGDGGSSGPPVAAAVGHRCGRGGDSSPGGGLTPESCCAGEGRCYGLFLADPPSHCHRQETAGCGQSTEGQREKKRGRRVYLKMTWWEEKRGKHSIIFTTTLRI